MDRAGPGEPRWPDVADQARLRTLFDGAPDAVVGLDGDGTVVLINAQAERWFATTRAEAVGVSLPTLVAGVVPAGDRERLVAAVAAVRGGRGDGLTLRHRVARRQGGHLVLEVLGRAVGDDSGGEVMLVWRDVSEQVRLEAALRAAKDEADRANQAKDRFLSLVSHELRTPLNAILGFGQLLEVQDLATDDAEAVRQVLRGGRQLLGLVDEVLDIGRIESEELVTSIRAVDLGRLVGGVLDLVAPLARQREVALDPRSASECSAWVEADPDRLRQVLLNLVGNGIKYNRPGGSVSLRATTGDGVVRIAVTDDGWGIPAAQQHRLFQPYDRLDAGATDVEGTGIGLALSRGLVGAMGGTIGVESVEGRGSTFWVELPQAAAPAAAPPEPDEDPADDRRAATILLIEDDPANAVLTQRILRRLGHVTVVVANSGEEGIALCRAAPPDLVLLDLHLPDMAGEEILAALRRQRETCAVPVVVMSADADPQRREALRAAGAHGMVTKPVDVPDLLRLVTEVLARRPR